MSQDSKRPLSLTQEEYFRTRLSLSLTASEIPDDTICSICKDECSNEDAEYAVVRILACRNCYFHTKCIKAWFTSTDQQRSTCPNDRRELFVPNPLSIVRLKPPTPRSRQRQLVTTTRSTSQWRRSPVCTDYERVRDLIESSRSNNAEFDHHWERSKDLDMLRDGKIDQYGDEYMQLDELYCEFFTSDHPYLLQSDLPRLNTVLLDQTHHEHTLRTLQQQSNQVERDFSILGNYIIIAVANIRQAFMLMLQRLSSIYLHPEATSRNLTFCASCITKDVKMLALYYPPFYNPQLGESLLQKVRSRGQLAGFTQPGESDKITFWEYTAKQLARSAMLLSGVPEAYGPFDSRLTEPNATARIAEFVANFGAKFTPRSPHAQPCACTHPEEIQPYCPNAFRGQYSAFTRAT